MRLPAEWLKDFVKISKNTRQLADDLTSLGFETEIDGSVLDLEVTPNRGDCLSVLGIARELGALYNLKIKNERKPLKIQKLNKPLKIDFQDKKICPRYTYCIIDDIKIKPSPKWIQERLIAYGFRPINNVVDVTNYVMIELGQPLHAFDYQKVDGCKMKVRRAHKGEKLITLDGIERELNDEAIVIEDNKKPIDLAGIMGGQNSEVDFNTRTIILQAAIFDPVLIRITSKKLDLVSDASYRYERQVDFEGTRCALERAVELIKKTTKSKTGEITDLVNVNKKPSAIEWEPEKDTENILGIKINEKEIFGYLTRLGFKTGKKIIAPSYRNDIKFKEDIVEEVARLYGYNRILKTILPKQEPPNQKDNSWFIKEKIKEVLSNLGFTEAKSYPYLSSWDLENFDILTGKCLEISNPLSKEYRFLRPTLLPTTLKSVAKNPWSSTVKMFEIGHVFRPQEEENIILISNVRDKNFEWEAINLEVLQKYKIKRQIYFKEMKLAELAQKTDLAFPIKFDFEKIKYQPLSPFPPVVFDLAILADENIIEETIANVIKETAKEVLFVEIFDVFSGPQLPKEKKSLAFHITLSSKSHTLTDDKIKNVRQKILTDLKNKTGARLRT